jgi:hypothetical protein
MSMQAALEEQLNSFDAAERRAALARLAAEYGDTLPPAGENVNLHCHSFFSYNALGWSPARVAWEGRKAGWYAAGLCDFDVLDGLEEFLAAGRLLGLRATVNLETRAYLAEYAAGDISSPGEPGVTYIMGGGFARMPRDPRPSRAQSEGPTPVPGGAGDHPSGEVDWVAGRGLAELKRRARERNVALVERVNARIQDVAIDYETDVLPLTPAGGATERHIVSAYIDKVRERFEHAERIAAFWSGVLGLSLDEAVELLADMPALEDAVRARLAKRGGLGYTAPSPDTFPSVDAFVRWVLSCEAIPMITWLDGTSPGERDARGMVDCLTAKGCAALNIIPDRNWNLKDTAARAEKVRKLDEIVALAVEKGLPVNIGTEMNKLGLPFVDDLDGEVLLRHKAVFLRGARTMRGQTILCRYAQFAYTGRAARDAYPDIAERNGFFEAVGGLPPLSEDEARRLEDLGPEKSLARLRDQV